MSAYKLPAFTLEIVEGDIARQATAAVVNAANSALWMGSGVAGALKIAGGPEIEREAMALGPIEPGSAVVTGGGKLPAKYVIHAAVMAQDSKTSPTYIEKATRRAIELAEDLGLESVSLPAFGTGVGGFRLDDGATVMLRAIVERAHGPKRSLDLVRLVLSGRAAYDVFVAVAARIVPPDAHRA